MPFYIVIQKSIKNGLFGENTKNPTKGELLQNITAYSQVHLWDLDNISYISLHF